MRIALVSEYVDGWRGGAETSTHQFLQELLSLGVEVDLYTRSPVIPSQGLTAHTINVPRMPRAMRTLRFSRAADDLLMHNNHDLVHAITPCMMADIYQPRGGTFPETRDRNLATLTSLLLRNLKRSANLLNLKQQIMCSLERKLLEQRRQPHVIAISEYVAEQFVRHYQLPSERIHHIFNGVQFEDDLQQASELGKKLRALYGVGHEDILALVIAHNYKLKGLTHWLRALGRLKQQGRNVITAIIGKGKIGRYRRQAQHLNIEDCVRFVGPTRLVSGFLAAADILIHPTYYDPCSRVVLEAMMHHVPCVTTRYNGAEEWLRKFEGGAVLSEPTDIDAMMNAMDSEKIQCWRENLKMHHSKLGWQLSMKRHAKEVLQLYEQLKTEMRAQ